MRPNFSLSSLAVGWSVAFIVFGLLFSQWSFVAIHAAYILLHLNWLRSGS